MTNIGIKSRDKDDTIKDNSCKENPKEKYLCRSNRKEGSNKKD